MEGRNMSGSSSLRVFIRIPIAIASFLLGAAGVWWYQARQDQQLLQQMEETGDSA